MEAKRATCFGNSGARLSSAVWSRESLSTIRRASQAVAKKLGSIRCGALGFDCGPQVVLYLTVEATGRPLP